MATPHPTYEWGHLKELIFRLVDLSATMQDIYEIGKSPYAWEAIEDLRGFFASPIFPILQIENPWWYTESAFKGGDTSTFHLYAEWNQFSSMLVYLNPVLPKSIIEELIRSDVKRLVCPWLVSSHIAFGRTKQLCTAMSREIAHCVDHSKWGDLYDDVLYSGRTPEQVCYRWGLMGVTEGYHRLP